MQSSGFSCAMLCWLPGKPNANCTELIVRVIQVSERFVNTPSKLTYLRVRGNSVFI